MLNLCPVIFALLLFPIVSTVKTDQQKDISIWYKCGHRIFSSQEIKEALQAAILHHDKGNLYPAPFQDSLYDDNSGFLIWPIKTHGKVFCQYSDSAGPHYIVINKNKEFVDIIVRLFDHSFARCLKYDPSRPDISEPAVKDSNGYQCGHVFLSDKNIFDAQYMAKNKLSKDSFQYPKYIKDPMYNIGLNYKIWPVRKPSRLFIDELEDVGPFYIVFDPNGDLVDVVAQMTSKRFVKCFRVRKVESASPHDEFSKLFVPAPVLGFHCGRMFFKEDYTNKVAALAAEVSRSTGYLKLRNNAIRLEKFGKEPFQSGTYLWPLTTSHKFQMTGSSGLFRVVLSSEFEVVGVIIKKKDQIYQCPKGKIKNNKNHDKNDFKCLGAEFSHKDLLDTAEKACKKLNVLERKYPAIYDGPKFEIEGPYLTYPILIYGHYSKIIDISNIGSGKYRLVMNPSCEIAGALFKEKNRFYKCRKKVDGVSGKSLIDNSEPSINEIFLKD